MKRYRNPAGAAGTQGRYLLPLPDSQPAELTFVETGPDHIAIDYSWVPPRYRGRGVALKLVEKAVEDARAKGLKITPLCGYVATEFRHHRSGRTCWKVEACPMRPSQPAEIVAVCADGFCSLKSLSIQSVK